MSKRGRDVMAKNDVRVSEASAAAPRCCGLTVEQERVLAAFRRAQGRRWKAALNELWVSGRDVLRPDGAVLRGIRNTLGPRWLQRYRPGAALHRPRAGERP